MAFLKWENSNLWSVIRDRTNLIIDWVNSYMLGQTTLQTGDPTKCTKIIQIDNPNAGNATLEFTVLTNSFESNSFQRIGKFFLQYDGTFVNIFYMGGNIDTTKVLFRQTSTTINIYLANFYSAKTGYAKYKVNASDTAGTGTAITLLENQAELLISGIGGSALTFKSIGLGNPFGQNGKIAKVVSDEVVYADQYPTIVNNKFLGTDNSGVVGWRDKIAIGIEYNYKEQYSLAGGTTKYYEKKFLINTSGMYSINVISQVFDSRAGTPSLIISHLARFYMDETPTDFNQVGILNNWNSAVEQKANALSFSYVFNATANGVKNFVINTQIGADATMDSNNIGVIQIQIIKLA